MKKTSLSQKFRYKFDNLMAKGTGALLGSLAFITILIVIIVSVVVTLTKASPGTGFIEILWMSLNRTLDAGTLGGDTGSVMFLLSMFVMTMAGIFIISMLIGLLNNGIEAKLESLRKGRSKVLEKDHTVILGWSEHIFTILQELIEANSNKKKSCIVIMGNKDKVEMDDEIKERVKLAKNTIIVTRQGNSIDVDDLEIVNLNESRSIIILDNNDSNVIKTILAITNNPEKRPEPYNIVATLKNPKNMNAAQIAGQNQVEIICTESLIARITAQTCRQPGLSSVYTELLDFGGDEIYITDCPQVYGKTFGEALMMFETSSVIGISKQDKTFVNPPMDTVIQKGDRIIAISADDDTVVPSSGMASINQKLMVTDSADTPKKEEKTLLLGWNEAADNIIKELDNYVCSGSVLTIVSPGIDEESYNKTVAGLANQQVELIRESTEDRDVLDQLIAKGYDHVIILCDDQKDLQEADSSTLITLLHLRDIAEKTGVKFSIVSEIMDFRNKKLAEVTKVNDFIVSEKLISLILSQVSENRQLNAVFEDLFDADGSEIYIKPAGEYVVTGEPVNLYTIVESARRKNEVVIGYVNAALQSSPQDSYGIFVNPNKSKNVSLTASDGIIVISEQ